MTILYIVLHDPDGTLRSRWKQVSYHLSREGAEAFVDERQAEFAKDGMYPGFFGIQEEPLKS